MLFFSTEIREARWILRLNWAIGTALHSEGRWDSQCPPSPIPYLFGDHGSVAEIKGWE